MREIIVSMFILMWGGLVALVCVAPLTVFQGVGIIAVTYAIMRAGMWLALEGPLAKMKALTDATILVLNAQRARIDELEAKQT